jgi:hypothetical protein
MLVQNLGSECRTLQRGFGIQLIAVNTRDLVTVIIPRARFCGKEAKSASENKNGF